VKTEAPASAGTTVTTATPSLPSPSDEVEGIRAYQRAARRIVRDPGLSFVQACMAILNLIREARGSEVAEVTIAAIWAEAGVFVTTGDRPLDREGILEELTASDPLEQAIRAQLRKQHVRCEACLRLLPTEPELDRRRTLRRAALRERLIREEAV
jgi:hypothetical protein